MIHPLSADIPADPLTPVDTTLRPADSFFRYRLNQPTAPIGIAAYDEQFCATYATATRSTALAELAAACLGKRILVLTPESLMSALRLVGDAGHHHSVHERMEAALRLLADRQGVALTDNVLDSAIEVAGEHVVTSLTGKKSLVTDAGVVFISPCPPLPPALTSADLPAPLAGQQPYWHLLHEIGHLHAVADGMEFPRISLTDRHRHECYADTFSAAMMLVQGLPREMILAMAIQSGESIDFLPARSWPNRSRSAISGATPGAWLTAKAKMARDAGHGDCAYATLHAQLEGLAHIGWAPRSVADARRAAVYGVEHGALSKAELAPDQTWRRLRRARRDRVLDLAPWDDLIWFEQVMARRLSTPLRPYPQELTSVPMTSIAAASLRWTLAQMADRTFASGFDRSMAMAVSEFAIRYRAACHGVTADIAMDIGPPVVL